MIMIPLPALPEQDLILDSSGPSRGEPHNGSVPPMVGRIALGGPLAVPVTPDYVAADPALRAFVDREAAHSVYHIAHLSVSFAAEPATPRLHTASIELMLSPGGHEPEPVAWSMSPLLVTDPARVERRFRLGPELKLQDMELSLGEVEKTVSRQQAEVFLRAQRELRSDPAWEFKRTKSMNMYGSYRLVMVVRSARDGVTSMRVTLRVATKGNLLRWYRSDLPEPISVTAIL
jgi:hypothetical protein